MIFNGMYIDLAATGVGVLASGMLAASLWLGLWQVPRWRAADAARRVLRSLAALDDFGRPVA